MDSYEDILNRMKEKYKQLTSFEVPEMSDIDIRMRVLAGEIFNDEVNLEFIKRQMFSSTATGEYLDYHASDRGLSRTRATKASGNVRFIVNEPALQPVVIPAHTVVATLGDNPVRFLTDSEVTLPAGSYYVSAHCTAQNGGRSGNVSENTIKTMVTNVVGIDSVNNIWAFTGGCDTEGDEELRKRILETYKSVSNGTNIAYYKRLALTVDGVDSVNVVPRARGTGTVDVYIACPDFSDPSQILSDVQSIMNSNREVNVDVRVDIANIIRANIGVEVELKDGYSLNDVRNNITDTVGAYINSLDVGEGIFEYPLSSAVLKADGVKNFSFNNIYPFTYVVEADDYIVLNEVFVTELEEEEE